MAGFELSFSGSVHVDTDLPPEVYRAKIVHLLERVLRSDTRIDGAEVTNLSLSVTTQLEYEPGKRYWEGYVGGHGEPVKVVALSEWDAREELRKRLQRRRLPNGTVLVETTNDMIQHKLI